MTESKQEFTRKITPVIPRILIIKTSRAGIEYVTYKLQYSHPQGNSSLYFNNRFNQ